MIKRILILLMLVSCLSKLYAGHIAGGEMFYTYMGPGALPNNNKYQITLRLFRECNAAGQAAPLPDEARICIFKGSDKVSIVTKDVTRTSFQVIQHSRPFNCIKFPPDVCYQVATYSFIVQLHVIPDDYTVSFQTCCRTNSCVNVLIDLSDYDNIFQAGSTYSCTIPGTNKINSDANSSPVFSLKDTVFLCAGRKVNLDFSATDADGDSLSYLFNDAYNGGNAKDASNVVSSAPPYGSVVYINKYSGARPLGSKVNIDSKTGIINGLAPTAGSYVVNVCVYEWRKGSLLSIHRKDFIVRVNSCDIPSAVLDPVTISCDSFTVNFTNESTSASINSYYWDLGVNGQTSSEPQATFTYKDTGTYQVKLVVNPGEKCTDSATTLVKVYPGFNPDFKVFGSCYTSPFKFTDATTTRYGDVTVWNWQFDDGKTDDDMGYTKDVEHYYNKLGTHNVKLSVESSKGCVDTISKTVEVRDKLLITLPFKDTLICKRDSLILSATAEEPSTYSWAPSPNIYNANTQNPIVFPDDTTLYIVTANTGTGCVNTDSIKVNVVDHTTLKIGNDTIICRTDTVKFHPVSNALYFAWTNDNTLSSLSVKDPLAIPVTASETYYLRASISLKCFADDAITIQAPPYPEANAGNDVSVCFGYTALLHASYSGNVFAWSPVNSLLQANTTTPIAGPLATTTYTFTVKDTSAQSCPKPASDSITILVIPPLHVFAGNDTNIVARQPLQLSATGADYYSWGPITGMNNSNSRNPMVTLNNAFDTVSYHVKGTTAQGCVGLDTLTVYVYKTLPDLFIPSAFTPNADGLNDRLIPVAAGIKKLNVFSIFNRLGQLLFTTTTIGEGWDGTSHGIMQPPGTYVYLAKAIDYLGKAIIKKGTVVIIR